MFTSPKRYFTELTGGRWVKTDFCERIRTKQSQNCCMLPQIFVVFFYFSLLPPVSLSYNKHYIARFCLTLI